MKPLSPDARILRALRATGAHLPDEQLALTTGLSADEIAVRIRELRTAGYEIEHDPQRGYRFISAPDRLIADDLTSRLDERCRLGREILVFEKTRSTNDIVSDLGRNGAAEGVIVFAETQTAGRGRLGRKWESSSHEGLWFSLLLRPQIPAQAWTRLTTWAAVAVAQGIEEVVPCHAMIKWPNDIFIREKKVAGILIESHPAGASEGHGFAVAGIGVNVNQKSFPEPLAEKAGSLRQVTGRRLDRSEVAVAIMHWLNALYPKLTDLAFPELLAKAEARSFLRGRWVEAQGTDGTVVAGIAESLDESGALRLRETDGTLTTIRSGEVTILSSRSS